MFPMFLSVTFLSPTTDSPTHGGKFRKKKKPPKSFYE